MPGAFAILPFATALGIGLLIGAERERRKGEGPKRSPAGIRAAVAGAALSTVATIVQMTVLLGATSRSTLSVLSLALLAAGLAAAAYGAAFTLRSLRREVSDYQRHGRAFSLKTAIGFAALIAGVLFISAAFNAWLGPKGVLAAATLAGFADTHSAAVSVASLVAAGKIPVYDAIPPILAALTTNTVTKIVAALTAGARGFALRIIPGLLLVIAAAWLAALPALLR